MKMTTAGQQYAVESIDRFLKETYQPLQLSQCHSLQPKAAVNWLRTAKMPSENRKLYDDLLSSILANGEFGALLLQDVKLLEDKAVREILVVGFSKKLAAKVGGAQVVFVEGEPDNPGAPFPAAPLYPILELCLNVKRCWRFGPHLSECLAGVMSPLANGSCPKSECKNNGDCGENRGDSEPGGGGGSGQDVGTTLMSF